VDSRVKVAIPANLPQMEAAPRSGSIAPGFGVLDGRNRSLSPILSDPSDAVGPKPVPIRFLSSS